MGERTARWICAVAATALIGAGTSGCSDLDSHALLEVDARVALADQAVHMRVSGLSPGGEVTVTSRAVDRKGMPWHGQATFRADRHGLVTLDTATPTSGTYRRPDGMGLFWSMVPRTGDPDHTSFVPPASRHHAYDVTLTATAHGHRFASRTVTREWFATGVTGRRLVVASDKVSGSLYLPNPGTVRHPAVLVFGGSEGGNSSETAAALLASHGYPALALGYFDLPGLPHSLENIPLEYFATAARLLAAQPEVDPRRILVMGYSRGSEAALLLADDYPGLVHGAVVYSPSAQVNGGIPLYSTAAWTKDGEPVADGLIPLNHVSGPVMAIAGSDDHLWTSTLWAQRSSRNSTPAATGIRTTH
ncbi:acyl-CoA thioesterase/BAAT N-terminal domain-containing protein [Streptomyces sp. NBC_01455]|uniref:acyl-CoA thioesterase/BAAT N-terminal domain-containing protein n=1 Tax=Streptomyces sp. NBC_01455 TaxID=2903874 RepID=UPI002E332A1A|nr:acyl-CoA thioesterase/BAAT N-terminal domain-containing protein [Streptomyces sp. NBC_01455]